MVSDLIDVIIPTYNYGKYVADAVNSALSQTYGAAEVIVVDDGSTDDTESVVEKFGNKIRYIKQQNAGVAAARNRGFKESTSDYIAFLDADDVWIPTKLEKQMELFKRDSRLGLVHCGMREFDSETGETILMHTDGKEGWVAKDLALNEDTVINGPGGAILVKRSVIEDVGGFDERLRNGEDWEFCLRVAQKYKIGFVPEPLVDYRNHGSNVSKNIHEMERSTLIAWQKAFSTEDASIRALRRRSYGNLHKVLAGSHLHYGNYAGFARNVVKSIWYRPSYIGYYMTLLFKGGKN